MTRIIFEQHTTDAAGRIAELTIPRADTTIETPALLPVINPHVQTISAPDIVELGADILITNAYILHQSDDLTPTVRETGVHELLGVSVPIMTDSGSYQLAAYGELNVTTEEILAFQQTIGSDIATPIDIPTPPDSDRDTAKSDLEQTNTRLETAAAFDREEMLITAPIQGATYPDLREHAARTAYETTLDIFPIGGMVPLLNDYRFADMTNLVVAAKHGLGADAPVHLFGAGHPMMFALAVALGCDLFDSAAYALYARENRYLTVNGTKHLEILDYFPCTCPICTNYTPSDLRNQPDTERVRNLAIHNLHVSFGEIRTIKHAIRTGSLLELVDQRARAHPALLDGYRALTDHTPYLDRHDPSRKNAFFYTSTESNHRPEIARYHMKLARITPPDPLTLYDNVIQPPADQTNVWPVIPPFGPVPPALKETYPVDGEFPRHRDTEALDMAVHGINQFVTNHPDITITLIHNNWPVHILADLTDHADLEIRSQNNDRTHGSHE